MFKMPAIAMLVFFAFLLSCSDNQKNAITSPLLSTASSDVVVEKVNNPAMKVDHASQQLANQELQDLIAAGKVDTVDAEQYRVEHLPAVIPTGHRAFTGSYRLTEADPEVPFAYVLPYKCGVYMVYIFEWGTGGSLTACAE